jgi:hypothetical protein
MYVRLIYSHAFACQIRSIINGNVVQVRMLLPIFIEDKEKFLSSSESKSR